MGRRRIHEFSDDWLLERLRKRIEAVAGDAEPIEDIRQWDFYGAVRGWAVDRQPRLAASGWVPFHLDEIVGPRPAGERETIRRRFKQLEAAGEVERFKGWIRIVEPAGTSRE